MFQLILRPSVFRNLIRHTTNNVRMFSSSTPTFPFMLIDYLTNFSSVEDDGPVTKWYGSSPPNCYNQKEILIRDLKLKEEVLEAMTSGFSRNQSFRLSDFYLSSIGDKSHILLKNKLSDPEYGEEYEGEDLDEDENYNDVVRSVTHKTKKFMVFREKETGYAEENKNEIIIYTEEDDKTMSYTEDIGDLCIFVGHSQAYCVPASSSPGLKPNCIYFVGYSFGVYDITTKTCTTFFTKDADEEDNDIVPLRRLDFPYWPPPFPL
ncbi:unnamed protein product [Eruca vesicaria subsp. sativa]|uniref:KIB1-4 beta-propeller domain-containing protein n=1 Tax=Eruca vesicaria subsp. sativa TaxID=29727 RepID=A0ABC8LD90_ERUVS|nr:unnamed protein product [Eruca vesicaria subsp. sativa]